MPRLPLVQLSSGSPFQLSSTRRPPFLPRPGTRLQTVTHEHGGAVNAMYDFTTHWKLNISPIFNHFYQYLWSIEVSNRDDWHREKYGELEGLE